MRNTRKESIWHVRKRTMLAVAGCVWMIAGVNVARLGIISYGRIAPFSAVHVTLSAVVFAAFDSMFYKMSIKHTKRIRGYKEAFRPVWHFFDLKGGI